MSKVCCFSSLKNWKTLNILAVQSLSLLTPSHACGRAEKSRGQQRMHAQGCAWPRTTLWVLGPIKQPRSYQQNSRKLQHHICCRHLSCVAQSMHSLAVARYVLSWGFLTSSLPHPFFHSHKNHKPDSRGGKGGQIWWDMNSTCQAHPSSKFHDHLETLGPRVKPRYGYSLQCMWYVDICIYIYKYICVYVNPLYTYCIYTLW